MITMLYIRSPEIIHLITESLHPLTNMSTVGLLSGSMSLTLLDATYK